uniref:Uncharacterized protein n=1 Tax=Panagrolaimus sp. ES5 TaxID=591445 RepID=A0AC34FMB1_9BILA
MLIIPFLYAATYWLIMDVPDTVYQVNVFDPRSYIIKSKNKLKSSADPIMPIVAASDAVNPLEDYEIQDLNISVEQKKLTVKDKVKLFWPLKKYMLPLSLVYIGEYLINQGLVSFIKVVEHGKIKTRLFGGAAYGNTFHRIHKEVAPDIREFSMSATTLADSTGIVIAALSAIPLHNFICNQQIARIKP